MARSNQIGPFGVSAKGFAEAGCAVLPCGGKDGKKPLVKGWNKWNRPTSNGGVDRFCAKFSDENIGLVCGRASSVTVVDVDEPSLLNDAAECFGDTSLKAKTPREGGGYHLYYRYNRERLHHFTGLDVLSDGGFVIAPPSINPKLKTPYRWIEGSGTIEEFEALKPIKKGAIDLWAERQLAGTVHLEVNEGCRNNSLFRALMRDVSSWPGDMATFQKHALKRNDDLCRPPLSDEEVTRTAQSAWSYQKRGQNWAGGEQRTVLLASEIDLLDGDADALFLLAFLRSKHLGLNKTFCISARAMDHGRSIQGWGEKRIRGARERLIGLGRLEKVHKGGSRRGDPSLYRLVE